MSRLAVACIAAGVTIASTVPVTSAQRGRGDAAPQASAQAAAPIDLTGYWVSVVTEDWRYRMVIPARGDHPSVPLNAEGIRVAGTWDPEKDAAAGDQCKAYGAAGVMRMPGRLHITWADPNTLQIETDAGTQTRLLHFSAPAPGDRRDSAPTWQGYSVAEWEIAGGRGGRRGTAAPPQRPRGGDLKVVTRQMRAGYLQTNGVPYSANATLIEYFNRVSGPNNASWIILTSVVEDPQYLTGRFFRSTHFRKTADGAGWHPTPCRVS